MPDYELLFFKALFFTISIETIVLFVIIKTFFKETKLANTTILFSGILASFATLPYLWFVLPHFIPSKITYIVVGELSVVFIESLIYFYILKIKYTWSLLLSAFCNLSSFLVGLVIM
jgi:hypothetical protein